MLLAIALPAVLAAGVNSGLAAAARALFDVPSSFTPLRPAAVIILTMAGTAAGAAGWLTVRKYAHRPKATLT